MFLRGGININTEELRTFLGEDYKIVEEDSEIKSKGMLFCIKLQSAKRKPSPEQPKKGGFGGFINKVTGFLNNNYMVCLKDGNLRFVFSNKELQPCTIRMSDLNIKSYFNNGEIKSSITAKKQDSLLESAEIYANYRYISQSICGNLKDVLLYLFTDYDEYNSLQNITDKFYKVTVYDYDSSLEDKVFNYKRSEEYNSLLTIYEDRIIVHNMNYTIDFKKVIAYAFVSNVYRFLVFEENCFKVYCLSEQSISSNYTISNLAFLIENNSNDENQDLEKTLDINIPKRIKRANEMLMASRVKCGEKFLILLVVDEDLFLAGNVSKLLRSSCFIYLNKLYIMFENSEFDFYEISDKVIKNIKELPISLDRLFRGYDNDQIAVTEKGDNILTLKVEQNLLKIFGTDFEFINFSNFRLISEEFCCKIKFDYKNQAYVFILAKPTSYEIWHRVEKALVEQKLKSMTIEGLYNHINELRLNRFLVGTFGEIIKANRILNKKQAVKEIMEQVAETDKNVLRSSLANLKSKFFTNEDLQESLLRKVAGIELERKIIGKLLDEWAIVYPHYMGQMEINWIKSIFGESVKMELLEQERWKAINNAKRLIQQAQIVISKYLFEIQMCTSRIQNAIPDEIKKIDTSKFRRIHATNITEKMTAGANVALGASVALGVTDLLIRGVYFTNPITLTMSTKMLVDSYAKDDAERRDIKTFGFQTLSWWETMIHSLNIVIIEAKQGFNAMAQASMHRDKELLKKLSPEQRAEAQKKLARLLAFELKEVTNEKFVELVPEQEIFVAHVVDDINEMYNNYSKTLESFGKNLIY